MATITIEFCEETPPFAAEPIVCGNQETDDIPSKAQKCKETGYSSEPPQEPEDVKRGRSSGAIDSPMQQAGPYEFTCRVVEEPPLAPPGKKIG